MNYILKNLHFIFIHIPLAMLVFSFVLDLAGKLLKKREWNTAGLLCLIIGTLGAVAAVLTGPNPWRNPIFPQHQLFGTITIYVAIALTLVRLFILLRSKIEIGSKWAYLPVSLVVLVLVGYTGHIGGQMVHPDRTKAPAPASAAQQGGAGAAQAPAASK